MRGFLDRIVLVASVVAAGCIPSFIVQYRQRAGGMLDQVLKDLAPFQTIADRLYGGSLKELVQHHGESADPAFYSEGAAIQAMAESAEQLRQILIALNTDLFHQLSYLIIRIDTQIASATWKTFTPAFGLSIENVIFGSIVGVSIWLIFLAVWHLFDHLFRLVSAR